MRIELAPFRQALGASVFIIAFVLLLPASSFAENALFFPETKYDFGKTGSTEQKEHVFRFDNKGDGTLKIIRTTPSCGCTAAVVGNPEIAPGGTGSIKVTFDPSGLAGHHDSTVLVGADDGSEATLTVSADIETLQGDHVDVTPLLPVIKVTPMGVNLGKMRKGDEKEYKVVVENTGDGELFIVNIHNVNETGIPLSHKPIGKGKKVEITFFYKALSKGVVKDSVLLQTNDPAHPEVRIKLKGFVK